MHGLTDRQIAVLRLAERGLDDPAIAGAFHIGLSTVLSHRRGIDGTLHIDKVDARRKRAILAWRRLAREVVDER
jgi:DNA-binding NarL/FixJ family response regulator